MKIDEMADLMRDHGVKSVSYGLDPAGKLYVTHLELFEHFAAKIEPKPLTFEEAAVERERQKKLAAKQKAKDEALLFAAVEGFPEDSSEDD